jgi:hypothetical protein
MKKLQLLLVLTILACGCGTDKQKSETKISKANSETSKPYPSKNKTIYSKRIGLDSISSNLKIQGDKSMYSASFLKELSEMNPEYKMLLKDGYLIIGKDTTKFPNELELGKWYLFTADRNGISLKLNVKRTNYTTLNFDFTFHKSGILQYSDKGEADLNPTFFYADEGADDVELGESWGAQNYYKKSKDCWVEIRMGLDKDSNGKNRAQVFCGCGKAICPDIDERIMLRTK